MLATDATGALVLVHQYRVPRDEWTLELPGGAVLAGEAPVAAAIREFEEETGLQTGEARFVFTLDLDLSTTLHRTHIFTSIARDPDVGRTAQFEIRRLRLHEALNKVHDGTITHAPTVAATLAMALNIGQEVVRA